MDQTKMIGEDAEEIQDAVEATHDDELITKLRQENLEMKKSMLELKNKALTVYSENKMIKADESIARQMAQLEYDMKLAQYFVDSRALPVRNAAEAYVIMKAGEEIGLKPMESLQTLHILKGVVSAWGKGMISILTRKGYEPFYKNETPDGVTVWVVGNGKEYQYRVDKKTEDALQKSQAMAFAPKNKMRYHGIRQIIRFHLPHLVGSIALEEEDDYDAADRRAGTYSADTGKLSESDENEIIEKAMNQESLDNLSQYYSLLDDNQRTERVREAFTKRKREIYSQKKLTQNA